MFTERAITSAFQRGHLPISPIDLLRLEMALNLEYGFAEIDHSSLIDLQRLDLVVCLSGRSDFSGENAESREQKFRQFKTVDTKDTITRLKHAIMIAYLAMREHAVKTGSVKPVPVYFNGTDHQNHQLRRLIKRNVNIFGFPSRLIIVDDIPLPNTMGQVIGLNYFLHTLNTIGLSIKHIGLVSSRYHLPRVMRAFGGDSPLLTKAFYMSNQDVLNRFSPELKHAMFDDTFFDALARMELSVFGAGKAILSNPNGEQDLSGDIEATVAYSSVQSPPSIAKLIPSNIISFYHALSRLALHQIRLVSNQDHDTDADASDRCVI